jgi:rhamnosyltransferase
MNDGALSVGLVVPTLNASEGWVAWSQSLRAQSLMPNRVLVIDSSSEDSTVFLAQKDGYEVIIINRKEFNHGATRQMAANLLSNCDILIFLTQDPILANQESLKCLIDCFEDMAVGVAYGRQLPHAHGKPIGSHARLYNYPTKSEVRSMTGAACFGIKTPFVSNSFAAYRRKALIKVGGFPVNTILSEDTFVASKMLMAGWKVAYCAEAKVFHSHDYSFIQEFKRYFDTGVFHAREPWIRRAFGNAEGEGVSFVYSELSYLSHCAPWLIPSSLIRTGLKYLGFRLGLVESDLPNSLKKRISMHRGYWV